MAIVTINDEHLTNIAGAIREKNGTEDTYKPSDMAAAISAIQAGGGSSSYPNLYFNLSGSYQYMSGSQYHVFDTSNATTLTFKYDVSFASYKFPVSITAHKGGTITETSYGSFVTNSVSSADQQKICSSLSSAVSNAEVSIDVTNYDSVRLYVYFNQNSTTYSKGTAIIVHDIVLS